jgi:murein DD-endopeptidase MepM/ murein hydrolase activator NlpD
MPTPDARTPPDAPSAPRKRDFAPAARRIAWTVALGAMIAAAGTWAWRQPFMAYPRTLFELSRMPAPATLPVPVAGVDAGRIADTWGAPRGADRRHEGVDIFAPRRTTVASTTRGIVLRVAETGLGGRQVWVLGPGGERHYYAHLDDWAPGLSRHAIVWPGTPLGGVGDSGNARGTPTHLHYGVYARGGAVDPLPRMRAHRAEGSADARDPVE